MRRPFCLMRLGAPHLGHVHLVQSMLALCSPHERALVLIGSADVKGRPDVPLAWEERREILMKLLAMRGVDRSRLIVAPLAELRTDGWDARWCENVRAACRSAFGGADPTDYIFGDDYAEETFARLGVALHRIARIGGRSGRELLRAIRTGDPAVLARYPTELTAYEGSGLDSCLF